MLIGIPKSKAEQIPWTFIDWNHAKVNSKSMYNTEYVNSGLITGTQWDVILNTMMSKLGMTINNITSSGMWGNYINDALTFSGTSSIFVSSTSYQYPFGNTSVTGSKLYKTGESASIMKYGLADIAGNSWEWTEENSNYSTSGQYREFRGGSFAHDYSIYSACYRFGNFSSTSNSCSVSFRVVLYMK